MMNREWEWAQEQDDGILWRELSLTHPVAQKNYVCNFCKRPIPKGLRHSKVVAVEDGKFTAFRIHGICSESEDA